MGTQYRRVAPRCHRRPHGHPAVCRRLVAIRTRFPPCEQRWGEVLVVLGVGPPLGRPRPRPRRCCPLVDSVPAIVVPRPCRPLPAPRCRPRVPDPVSSWSPSLLSLSCPGPGRPCRPLSSSYPPVHRSGVWRVLGRLHRQQF
jgi:hypothetical protein